MKFLRTSVSKTNFTSFLSNIRINAGLVPYQLWSAPLSHDREFSQFWSPAIDHKHKRQQL